WLHSELTLYWTEEAVDLASKKVYVQVLEWWNSSGLRAKIPWLDRTCDMSSRLDVLERWTSSGLEMPYHRYDSSSLDFVMAYRNLPVLGWWKARGGLELKYTDAAMDGASQNNRLDFLEWWKSSGL
ncbi:hypothetical protein BJ742DRAFT_666868, partial [Cladochytrium replicatum]